MKIQDRLKLMNLLQKVNIIEKDTYYELTINYEYYNGNTEYPVSALIKKENGEVEYFINDVYNNGQDYAEIDMEALKILQEVIKELKE